MSIRAILEYIPEKVQPDYSTLSRTRRLVDLETHGRVLTWMLERLVNAKLVRGKLWGATRRR